MSENELKITTGEAAEVVHVHESSIKRWCDAGDIRHVLTPGGHRRVVLSSLLAYAKEEGLDCEYVPFGADAELVYHSVRRAREERFAPSVALLFGQLRDGRADLIGPFLKLLAARGVRLERLLDDVVAPVLHRVGNGWSDGSLGIGDEHRMSSLITDALYELRPGPKAFAEPDKTAVVGCLGGNRHDIGANMARMVLESAGWKVVYLGPDVPVHEFILQQQRTASALVGVALAPPQVASDAKRTLRVLGGLYHPDTPYRLALGGKPVRQLEESEVDGHPFADCRAFDSLDDFSKWL